MTIEKITLNYPESKSADITQENIDQLKQLFPEVFSEGKIDFDALKAVLGEVVDDSDERYNFTWHGKTRARQIAQTPSTGTLRPCKEESVNWDTTENLFIEGDNLEVLKLLQKAYHKKVKMIYIDPPYNTGKDFVYKDNFQNNIKNYFEITGQLDSSGKKISTNSESSGRFHSDWLSMIYPRLKLARNLLSDNGTIFISIDDNEFNNLKLICDEIFGEENNIINFTWKTEGNFDNQAKVKNCHEYILFYAKNAKNIYLNPIIDPNVSQKSKLFNETIKNTIVKNGSKNPVSTVVLPKGFPSNFEQGVIEKRCDSWPHYFSRAKIENYKLLDSVEISSGWSSKDLLLEFISNGCNSVSDIKGQPTSFYVTSTGAIEAEKVREKSSHIISVLQNLGGSQKGTAELEKLGIVFDDYPKPVKLIEYLCSMCVCENDIVLDFFAGSATTAHAVMNLNIQNELGAKFILIQLPEEIGKDKKSYQVGFKNISEISLERIKKVSNQLFDGRQIKSNGVKYFKLSETNIRSWDVNFDNLEPALKLALKSIKDDRSVEDILYEILLKYGIELTTHVEEAIVEGKRVFVVGTGALIVCLDDDITEQVVEGIVKLKEKFNPESTQVVFKDQGFVDSVVKANTIQILKQYGIDDVKSI
ncbi:site-specific DNA-methyltransferase [Xenorhabdus khoisanae]|uniref:site-specific DNA-methyltransferase n=1 Tax=Xenorhabdus khoisanae TaxID=880157 RepID=UPI003D6DC0CB